MKKKIVILASGNGSNAENIIVKFRDDPEVEVALIITNNPAAGVINRAAKHRVECWQIKKSDLQNPDFITRLNNIGPDLIVLAGFLLKIPALFINEFEGKIINIHPSLLPKYGGKGMYGNHVHQAVVDAEENQSGISIHYVNQNYDEGEIISQHTCEVLEEDSAGSLAERIHLLEFEHYPKIIKKLLNDG